MEIRILGDGEMQDAYYLSAQAFRNGARDDNFAQKRVEDKNKPESTGIGIFDSAGLQAKVIVIHYQEVFGDSFVAPMGGIGGVACLPASRGKGYAAAGLKYALELMHERGIYLSSLYPFSWSFYRKFGWEWVGVQRQYLAPTRILQTVPETEQVRAATPGDHEAIAEAYRQFSLKYRGMAVRSESAWHRILRNGDQTYRYTYLFEADGAVEGYLTFGSPDRETTWIDEFVCNSRRAHRALLGLLKRHEMQIKAFKWNAPADDALWLELCHNDLSTRIEPVVQARVVDVKSALEALKPMHMPNTCISLKISDPIAPWNDGVWKLCSSDGVVSVERSDAEPEIGCDIQALTQAYYGAPDLDALRSAERLTVSNETSFSALKSLLNGPPMWLNDHF